MSKIELFITALGLSMDAFALAVSKGLAFGEINIKHMTRVGLYFGFFQAFMPFLGYCLGSGFADYIICFDHWIAFFLLSLIGANMVREAFGDNTEENRNTSLSFKTMIIMSLATSIDALAVGVSLSFFEDVNILQAILFIGVITFFLSFAGVKIGNIAGSKQKTNAELAGGIILILMGTKILLEHLGIINF